MNKKSGNSQLVGYFDILGTKEKVLKGQFSDAHICDFVNSAGIMAKEHPKIKVAAFSDSVVISCADKYVREFVKTIRELYLNWWGDHIFVRGGVALGEIRWVNGYNFRIPNFTCARVYGAALVKAVELAEESGPGILCFVDEEAAIVINRAVPGIVLPSLTPILNWIPVEKIEQLTRTVEFLSERTRSELARRHLVATLRFLKQLHKGEKKD